MHVTVVMPTYNRAYCLERAVRSVERQTFADWELLVVDDGSTDGTEELCAKLKSEIGVRFDYVKIPNGGASNARNIGVFRSAGDFIAFLDSDDVYEPEKLGIQVAMMSRFDDVALSFTNWSTFYDNDEPGDKHQLMPAPFTGNIYPSLLTISRNFIVTPSVMVRRDAIMSTGMFDTSMAICEDIDLWRRISRRSRALRIDAPLVGVHIRRGGPFPYLSSLRGRLRLYEKSHAEDRDLPDSLFAFLFAEMFRVFAEVAQIRGDRHQHDVLTAALRKCERESAFEQFQRICESAIASIEVQASC